MIRRTTWWCCVVLALGGCAPGNPGLVIGGVLAPSDTCSYESSGTQLLAGTLDVAPALAGQPVSYSIVPIYFNQLINLGESGTSGPPMADPNVMFVQEAQVELRDFNGTPLAFGGLPNPYRVPATGFIPSSDGTTAGEGIGAIEVIPQFYGAALAGAAVGSEIVVAVQAIGRTAGDAEVISPEFEWPIRVCNGCLYACQLDEEMMPLCVPSCTPGQDQLTITPGVCGGGTAFGNCAATP